MNIKDYLRKINKRTNELNKKAQNPFLQRKMEYNPFEGAFSQTYVWIEKETKKEKEKKR
jgi:hypothetical protein